MRSALRLRHYDRALYNLSLFYLPRLGENLDTGKYIVYTIPTFICVIEFIISHTTEITYLKYLIAYSNNISKLQIFKNCVL